MFGIRNLHLNPCLYCFCQNKPEPHKNLQAVCVEQVLYWLKKRFTNSQNFLIEDQLNVKTSLQSLFRPKTFPRPHYSKKVFKQFSEALIWRGNASTANLFPSTFEILARNEKNDDLEPRRLYERHFLSAAGGFGGRSQLSCVRMCWGKLLYFL